MVDKVLDVKKMNAYEPFSPKCCQDGYINFALIEYETNQWIYIIRNVLHIHV